MGCGIGRWAYFLKDIVGEIVLVDFSESIFEARKNLSNAKNAIFIMGDVLNLPFRDNAFDFVYSLGVFDHTSESALQSVRYLSRFSPELLIFLYYNLDNRGLIYKQIFKMVNVIRVLLCNITSSHARTALTELLMWLLYLPPIVFGKLLFKISINPEKIPLSSYSNMSLSRIRQDERFSKKEILELSDTFSEIVISDEVPYWHFLCKK
jgi:SAM-dependent methyltransferase